MSRDEVYIDAKMATQIIENEFANLDPFNKSWEELSSLNGLNKNFKKQILGYTEDDKI